MENIKDANYYAKKIVEESRHKFIYAYECNRKLLISAITNKYPIMINSNHSALYMRIEGLPKFDTTINLNNGAIKIMNMEYLNFKIASELIKSLINNNDIKSLTEAKDIMLNYINRLLMNEKINDLETLLKLLTETKEIYHQLYLNYLQKGILEDPTTKTPFSFLELESFIHYFKKMLNTASHISLVLDHKEEISEESYQTINSLIASRINSNISVNVITSPDTWKTYLDMKGQLIEAIHDYEDIEYDDSSTVHLAKMKKKYK